MKTYRTRWLFLCAVGICIPAQASMSQAVESYLLGDYTSARKLWATMDDNPVALFNLGMLYLTGLGVPREVERGAGFIRQAAVRGHAPAQYRLARLMIDQEISADGGSIRHWLEAAANQDHHEAAYWLGRVLGDGKWVQKNLESALAWLKKAELYGVAEAEEWIQKLGASLPGVGRWEGQQINARLKSGNGTLRQRREFFNGQKAFINQDYDTAVRIWVPLAEAGMANAQYGIAFMLESGWGVVQDYAEAAYWYKLAAQKGHRKAQFNLGKMYVEGAGIESNRGIGLFWIQSAADLGEVRAQEYMASLQNQ